MVAWRPVKLPLNHSVGVVEIHYRAEDPSSSSLLCTVLPHAVPRRISSPCGHTDWKAPSDFLAVDLLASGPALSGIKLRHVAPGA